MLSANFCLAKHELPFVRCTAAYFMQRTIHILILIHSHLIWFIKLMWFRLNVNICRECARAKHSLCWNQRTCSTNLFARVLRCAKKFQQTIRRSATFKLKVGLVSMPFENLMSKSNGQDAADLKSGECEFYYFCVTLTELIIQS